MKEKIFWIKSICLFIVLIAIDQITKLCATIYLMNKPAFVIINNVFELRYLENRSAAFGKDPITLLNSIFHWFAPDSESLLRAKMIFFAILTLVVLVLVILLLKKIPNESNYFILKYTLVIFMSGAVGNLIDRVFRNYVIDFFYFKLIDFPIFNVADIYVTVTAFLLVFLLLFKYKDKDFDIIFSRKKGEAS